MQTITQVDGSNLHITKLNSLSRATYPLPFRFVAIQQWKKLAADRNYSITFNGQSNTWLCWVALYRQGSPFCAVSDADESDSSTVGVSAKMKIWHCILCSLWILWHNYWHGTYNNNVISPSWVPYSPTFSKLDPPSIADAEIGKQVEMYTTQMWFYDNYQSKSWDAAQC